MVEYFRLMIIILALGFSTAFGQDWVEKDLDGISYNCEVVRAMVEAYGDRMYVQIDDMVFTVEDYHAFIIPGCMASSEVNAAIDVTEASGPLFQITVDNVINLRACASTSCALLGRAQAGDLFDVVGEDDAWYEIAFEGGSAFIAAWLTRKAVDPPTGLLADFQFAALNPYEYFSDILHGTTRRIGAHWLNLRRTNGSPAAYELQAMNWGIDATAEAYSHDSLAGANRIGQRCRICCLNLHSTYMSRATRKWSSCPSPTTAMWIVIT